MRSGLQGQFKESEHRRHCAFKQIVAASRIRHFSAAVGDASEPSLSDSSCMPHHPFTDGKMKQSSGICFN